MDAFLPFDEVYRDQVGFALGRNLRKSLFFSGIKTSDYRTQTLVMLPGCLMLHLDLNSENSMFGSSNLPAPMAHK